MPTVTSNTDRISKTPGKLVIRGTGFSTNVSANTVVFNLNAVGYVISATAIAITVAFTSAPTATGLLTAVVTTNGTSSGAPVTVATVVSAPTVTKNTGNIGLNETTLVIAGTNFDPGAKSAVVTISNASPAVVTWSAHGLVAGQRIKFATTGALPAGLSVGTAYYVLAPTTNTFQVSLSIGGAAINTTTNGTGVHTAYTGNNTVVFNKSAGFVSSSTSTSLTVTFTEPLVEGVLSAIVIVYDVTSGKQVQVAKVCVAPTVDEDNSDLSQYATTITITGTGFGVKPNKVIVIFSSGAGIVQSVSNTSVVVRFTEHPDLGSLTAIVGVTTGKSLLTSGNPVQVATVVSATIQETPWARILQIRDTLASAAASAFDAFNFDAVVETAYSFERSLEELSSMRIDVIAYDVEQETIEGGEPGFGTGEWTYTIVVLLQQAAIHTDVQTMDAVTSIGVLIQQLFPNGRTLPVFGNTDDTVRVVENKWHPFYDRAELDKTTSRDTRFNLYRMCLMFRFREEI